MRIVLTIALIIMLALNSKAQHQQQTLQKIQQIQALLGVNTQSASKICDALQCNQTEILNIRKSLSYTTQQKEQLLAPLLKARQSRIDSVMTPSQQQLFSQKQRQYQQAAMETLKVRSASTRQQLQHPVSGGAYKPR